MRVRSDFHNYLLQRIARNLHPANSTPSKNRQSTVLRRVGPSRKDMKSPDSGSLRNDAGCLRNYLVPPLPMNRAQSRGLHTLHNLLLIGTITKCYLDGVSLHGQKSAPGYSPIPKPHTAARRRQALAMTNSSETAYPPPTQDREISEGKKAEKWDRTITLAIVLLLAVPLPFARFETWPHGRIFPDRIIAPWSRFRICYTSPSGGETHEDVYRFTWTGRLITGDASPLNLFLVASAGDPSLKWQDYPETPLKDMVQKGRFLRVETFWQPLFLWPFRMAWHIRDDDREEGPMIPKVSAQGNPAWEPVRRFRSEAALAKSGIRETAPAPDYSAAQGAIAFKALLRSRRYCVPPP